MKEGLRAKSINENKEFGGCSSMVEQKPSKLMTRVRFPSPAPRFQPMSETSNKDDRRLGQK